MIKQMLKFATVFTTHLESALLARDEMLELTLASELTKGPIFFKRTLAVPHNTIDLGNNSEVDAGSSVGRVRCRSTH